MKTKKIRRSAFFNLRVLAAFLLFLTAGMLTLFAFAGEQQPANNTQAIRSSGWLTRLASTLGIVSRAQGGGAIKLDKYPAERPPGSSRNPHARSIYRTARTIFDSRHAGSHGEVARHAANRSGEGRQSLSSGTDSSEDSEDEVAGQRGCMFKPRRDRRRRRRLRPVSTSKVSA